MPWNSARTTLTAATFGAPREFVASTSMRAGAAPDATAAGAWAAAKAAMSSGSAVPCGMSVGAADEQSGTFSAVHSCSTRATPVPMTALSGGVPASVRCLESTRRP